MNLCGRVYGFDDIKNEKNHFFEIFFVSKTFDHSFNGLDF